MPGGTHGGARLKAESVFARACANNTSPRLQGPPAGNSIGPWRPGWGRFPRPGSTTPSRGVTSGPSSRSSLSLTLFPAHLSLGYGMRKIHRRSGGNGAARRRSPAILAAGDGNIYAAGRREGAPPLFRKGLFRNANDGNMPTYPSGLPAPAPDFVPTARALR